MFLFTIGKFPSCLYIDDSANRRPINVRGFRKTDVWTLIVVGSVVVIAGKDVPFVSVDAYEWDDSELGDQLIYVTW